MNDPAILFAKPKAIKPEDKKALQKAGVIVVEVDDPNSVKLTRPHAELSGSRLLEIACKVLSETGSAYIQQSFGKQVAEAVVKQANAGSVR